jgi:small-conductance mechanosensitive channel
MKASWIPIEKVENLIQAEYYIVCWVILFLAFVVYRLFLRGISPKRHETFRDRYRTTAAFMFAGSLLSLSYWQVVPRLGPFEGLQNAPHYLALLTMFVTAIVFVKLGQILIYTYLFSSHMSVGVPRLVANLFTLLISTLIATWIASNVFGFRIETVLATSAIFSLVVGLALQDTLGNLFSGVALQIDKPYRIGDWIEIQNGTSKWSGQVHEITWRGTFLMSSMDELVLIPNKTIGQSQIFIFSAATGPFRVGHTIRIPFHAAVEDVKKLLVDAVNEVVKQPLAPEPRALLVEISESWFTFKIFYSLYDYGTRYRIGDQVLERIVGRLRESNIKFAIPSYSILSDER